MKKFKVTNEMYKNGNVVEAEIEIERFINFEIEN